MAEVDDADGLVPSRRVSRRARRRTTAVSAADVSDPLTAALTTLLGLQATSEAIVTEIRELRRRVTALASKVEALDQQLTTGAAVGRLRSTEPPAKKAAAPATKKASAAAKKQPTGGD